MNFSVITATIFVHVFDGFLLLIISITRVSSNIPIFSANFLGLKADFAHSANITKAI